MKELNNSGGAPLETLIPDEARKVLENAQKSVEVDYSSITESEKDITQDDVTVRLDIKIIRWYIK